jgi:hypothetical protein
LNIKWFDSISEYVLNWGQAIAFIWLKMVMHISFYLVVALRVSSKKILIKQKNYTLRISKEKDKVSSTDNTSGTQMALTRDFKQTVVERVERAPSSLKRCLMKRQYYS